MIVEVENEDPIANAKNQINMKSSTADLNDDKYYAIPSLLPSSQECT
eukprot:gene16179-22004_t